MTFDSQHINRGGVITADFLNAVADAMIRRITVNGGRVSRIGGSVIIDIDNKVSHKRDGFWAIVYYSEQQGVANNYVWKYYLREVVKTDSAANTWDQVGPNIVAWNVVEVLNTDNDAMQGNGIDKTNLVSSGKYCYKLKPVPNGTIVRIYNTSSNASWPYWFQYENGVDGVCGDCT